MKIEFPKLKRQLVNSVVANCVPNKYYPYLFDMNYIYYTSDSVADFILERNKEVDRIFNCFLRNKKANVVLLGEHGVGKTAIQQKVVLDVIAGKCPKELLGTHFFYLDVELILGKIETKSMQRLLESMINFISQYQNVVVVVDQVHFVQADYLLSYYFGYLIKLPHIKVMAISTEEEFYTFFDLDKKTRARMEVINIQEPKPDKIYPMICKVVKNLEKTYGVHISKEMIQYIISVSAAFPSELYNPELTLDIIEKSMIVTKKKHKKKVTKKAVNYNLNFKYDMYKKMSLQDREIVAYHEAGHFVVSKMSKNIKNYKTTAITIIPSEDFLGVTLFEYQPEKQQSLDTDYYIDNIAVDLAGRVAEKIYLNCDDRYTSGARSDLVSATETARSIVAEYGMIDECGKNMAYLGELDLVRLSLISEKIRNSIDEESKKLIKKAEERATAILNENIDLLIRIASELLSNEVLVERDLERICEEENEKKKEANS